MMSDFVVLMREFKLAFCTFCGGLMLTDLIWCYRWKWLLLGENFVYFTTFWHDVLVKVVRYVGSSVYYWACLILFDVRNSIATVTGHLMFVNYTGLGIGIWLLIGGNEGAFKITNKEEFMGMLVVVVFKLQFGIVSLLASSICWALCCEQRIVWLSKTYWELKTFGQPLHTKLACSCCVRSPRRREKSLIQT